MFDASASKNTLCYHTNGYCVDLIQCRSEVLNRLADCALCPPRASVLLLALVCKDCPRPLVRGFVTPDPLSRQSNDKICLLYAVVG